MDTPEAGVARRITALIRDEMASAGVSQRRLADLTGLPLVTLNRRLASAGKPFDLGELLTVADVLGLSLSAIIQRAEQDAPVDTPGAA